jgi:PIN domain nuclease of toxin-antitoxin system
VIVDAHVMLWWGITPDRVSSGARAALTDGRHRLLWSVASSWELAIKVRTGKLRLALPLSEFLDDGLGRQGVELLLVEQRHAIRVASLPLHHRDPFDRMLVAQAQIENVPILSADPKLRAYDVEVIW